MAALAPELTTVESGGVETVARTNALVALFGRLKENATNAFKEVRLGGTPERRSGPGPPRTAERRASAL